MSLPLSPADSVVCRFGMMSLLLGTQSCLQQVVAPPQGMEQVTGMGCWWWLPLGKERRFQAVVATPTGTDVVTGIRLMMRL
jgi:hypothetical protein